jgi:hypothetical protein
MASTGAFFRAMFQRRRTASPYVSAPLIVPKEKRVVGVPGKNTAMQICDNIQQHTP